MRRGAIAVDLVRSPTILIELSVGLAVGMAANTARRAHAEVERAARLSAVLAERERLSRHVHDGVLQVLAMVARLVNDYTTDENRSRLTELIPAVIGLTTDDPRADVRIALRSATAALPVASAKRQNVMAVSVLAAERALAGLDGRDPGGLEPASVAALDHAPRAAAWAREFVGRFHTSADDFHRFAAPHVARTAVEAVTTPPSGARPPSCVSS